MGRGEEPRVLTGDGGEAHGGTVEARLRERHSSMVLFPSWPTARLEPSRRLGQTEFEACVCVEAKWGCGVRKEEEEQEHEWPGSICPVMLEESERLLLPGHPVLATSLPAGGLE